MPMPGMAGGGYAPYAPASSGGGQLISIKVRVCAASYIGHTAPPSTLLYVPRVAVVGDLWRARPRAGCVVQDPVHAWRWSVLQERSHPREQLVHGGRPSSGGAQAAAGGVPCWCVCVFPISSKQLEALHCLLAVLLS